LCRCRVTCDSIRIRRDLGLTETAMGMIGVYCYASGRDGHWQAVCLDYDLMVEGRSLEDVKERLTQMVRTYREDALAEPEPARSQLLSRRAPWHVWLAWKLPFLKHQLFDRNRDGDSAVGFQVCPV